MTRSNIKPVWRGKPANDANTMPNFVCPKCNSFEWHVFEKQGRDGHSFYGASCHVCDTYNYWDDPANMYVVQRPDEKSPRVWRLTKKAAMSFTAQGAPITNADVEPEPTPPCSYSGCTETRTQMHHVAPRSIFENADWYPLVPLCRAHHVAYHQRLDEWKAEGPK